MKISFIKYGTVGDNTSVHVSVDLEEDDRVEQIGDEIRRVLMQALANVTTLPVDKFLPQKPNAERPPYGVLELADALGVRIPKHRSRKTKLRATLDALKPSRKKARKKR